MSHTPTEGDLAIRERAFAEALNPLDRARRLRAKLADIAAEMELKGSELHLYEAELVRQAQDLLLILGTEVERLRLAIGHHRYGRLESRELWRIPETWNGGE